MANKTIHELTPASTVSSDYEFAVYDIDGSTTKKATAEQVLKTSSLLYADDQAEPTGEVSFVSQDTMLTPAATDTLSVELLQGTDTWGARFQKISQMFRNIRYLLRTMGTTDISSIGNGTVTSALSNLNSDVNNLNTNIVNLVKFQSVSIPNSTFAAGSSVSVNKDYTPPTGYNVSGITSVRFDNTGSTGAVNQSYLVAFNQYYNSGKLYATIRNYNSSSTAKATVQFQVFLKRANY